jgi:hypothetical protein
LKKLLRLSCFLGLYSACALVNYVAAESQIIEIEGAKIRGNQELPTVLYLVPWQAAKVFDLEKKKETLASKRPSEQIDRASFKRLLSYHEHFVQQQGAENQPVDAD